MNDKLRTMLLRHEGIRLKPYEDTVGKTTIGVGRNLTDNGISLAEAELMFESDVKAAQAELVRLFDGYGGWSEARQNAMTDMMFNLGATRFGGFKKMIAAIRVCDWRAAATEMRSSTWARQLPSRVTELADMVERG